MSTPFNKTPAELKQIRDAILSACKALVHSDLTLDGLIEKSEYPEFHAWNVSAFNVIEHVIANTTLVSGEEKPKIFLKRLIYWFIEEKDFSRKWKATPEEVFKPLGVTKSLQDEVKTIFEGIVEARDFDLVFLDASQLSRERHFEGNFIPVLQWKGKKVKTLVSKDLNLSFETETKTEQSGSKPELKPYMKALFAAVEASRNNSPALDSTTTSGKEEIPKLELKVSPLMKAAIDLLKAACVESGKIVSEDKIKSMIENL
jgi:hypothetical protein